MNEQQQTKLSRFLSLVLRHKPQAIGLSLDDNGWANVDDLLGKLNQYGKTINFETLNLLVENNSKQRFVFNSDKSMIRANQGHSIDIDLGYVAKPAEQVPVTLYHGTASRFVKSIFAAGAIEKMQRHHVHLSGDIETARAVGQRHGKWVVFAVDTQAMLDAGHQFYQADNGVWLTDSIPVSFIHKLDGANDKSN